MILTENGVLKLMQRIKSYIASQLNTKAASVHTHTLSEIDDLSSLQMGGGYSKSEVDTLLNDYIPKSGTNALSGNLVPASDNTIDIGSSGNNIKGLYSKNIYISGSGNGLRMNNSSASMNISVAFGASIDLCGKDYTYGNNQGKFILTAFDGNTYKALAGSSDDTLTWGSKNVAMQEDVIHRSCGSVITGFHIGRIDNSSEFSVCGGTAHSGGGYVKLLGDNHSNVAMQGTVILASIKSGAGHSMTLFPDGTWVWDGQPIQYISDQRYKQQINEIDDKLLDAWEDVNLVQFKYNDAVDQKKDKARLHTGYVVQQIDEACKSHNVDISDYGLYCHEDYPEETEEVEIEQEDGTIKKETKVIHEASEHYSLRYTETLVVECAYLRREINKLKEELKQLKTK